MKQTQVVAPYILPQGDHHVEIQIWHTVDVEASQDWWQGISTVCCQVIKEYDPKSHSDVHHYTITSNLCSMKGPSILK